MSLGMSLPSSGRPPAFGATATISTFCNKGRRYPAIGFDYLIATAQAGCQQNVHVIVRYDEVRQPSAAK